MKNFLWMNIFFLLIINWQKWRSGLVIVSLAVDKNLIDQTSVQILNNGKTHFVIFIDVIQMTDVRCTQHFLKNVKTVPMLFLHLCWVCVRVIRKSYGLSWSVRLIRIMLIRKKLRIKLIRKTFTDQVSLLRINLKGLRIKDILIFFP